MHFSLGILKFAYGADAFCDIKRNAQYGAIQTTFSCILVVQVRAVMCTRVCIMQFRVCMQKSHNLVGRDFDIKLLVLVLIQVSTTLVVFQ